MKKTFQNYLQLHYILKIQVRSRQDKNGIQEFYRCFSPKGKSVITFLWRAANHRNRVNSLCRWEDFPLFTGKAARWRNFPRSDDDRKVSNSRRSPWQPPDQPDLRESATRKWQVRMNGRCLTWFMLLVVAVVLELARVGVEGQLCPRRTLYCSLAGVFFENRRNHKWTRARWTNREREKATVCPRHGGRRKLLTRFKKLDFPTERRKLSAFSRCS